MSPRPDLGPKPRLGYALSRIDRVAERRADATALAALERGADARAYAIGGELVVLRKTAAGLDPLFVFDVDDIHVRCATQKCRQTLVRPAMAMLRDGYRDTAILWQLFEDFLERAHSAQRAADDDQLRRQDRLPRFL